MHALDPHALALALADLGASADEPVVVKATAGAFLVRVPRLGAMLRLPTLPTLGSAALASA